MSADVIVVGGGPCGLMLAAELALGGVAPVVLEALTEPSREPRANGLVGEVVTTLDRRGLYEPLAGHPGPPVAVGGSFFLGALPLDLGLLDEHAVHRLPVPQRRLVEVLAARAAELGVDVRPGHRVTALTRDDDGVTVDVDGPGGPDRLRAGWLVGADGAHSAVRTAAGIGFPGVAYDRVTTRSAHVALPAGWVGDDGALVVPGCPPVAPFVPRRTPTGGVSVAPLPGGPPLLSTSEWDQPASDAPMTLDEMRASVRRVLGADVPLSAPDGPGPHVLRRRAGEHTRMAERFRDGRVLLVGDAAHVYAAGGGPGLNLGLTDAVNLGWKLAATVRGRAPEGLLDTYAPERQAAARRKVIHARAQAALLAPGDDVTALGELVGELLADPAAVRRVAALVAGTDVRYPTGEDDPHPLAGFAAPEVTVTGADGAVRRLGEMTAAARPLLLDGTDGWAGAALGPHGDLDVVPGRLAGAPGVTALLVRPDGHVAWASGSPRRDADDEAALRRAVVRWVASLAPPSGPDPSAGEPEPDRSTSGVMDRRR